MKRGLNPAGKLARVRERGWSALIYRASSRFGNVWEATPAR